MIDCLLIYPATEVTMAERFFYMVIFLRNLAVVVLPLVLRLIAEQIEAMFQKGGAED